MIEDENYYISDRFRQATCHSACGMLAYYLEQLQYEEKYPTKDEFIKGIKEKVEGAKKATTEYYHEFVTKVVGKTLSQAEEELAKKHHIMWRRTLRIIDAIYEELK